MFRREAADDHKKGENMGDMKGEVRIASSTPGRLRLRMYHPGRHPEFLQRVKTYLTDRPGIHRVDANHTTGSITIRYDTDTHSYDSLITLLHDMGVILRDVMSGGEWSLLDTGQCTAAAQMSRVISDLDNRIFQLTGGKVNLKLIIPLTMGAIGIRQIIRHGLGISQVPGYVLVWYAVDAFFRLHPKPQNIS
ncbi:MAG: HMA2 domain-containing protein [bacterium]